MKNYLFLFLAGLVMCSCVKRTDPIETVAVDFNVESSDSFIDKVSGITLIPLETNDSLLIGANNELIMADGEYYLVNQQANDKVFRFSAQGKFLNSIGTKGRGPGEYSRLQNAQITGDTVIIFSSPGMVVNFYQKDGTFLLAQSDDRVPGMFFHKIGEDYLAYVGYGIPPARLCLLSSDHKIDFLKTDARVINITEDAPVFFTKGNDIYLRESYSDTVHRYDMTAKVIIPYLKFQMGKYAIDKSVFQFEDPMQSAEYFLSKECALVNRYMENDKMRFVEIMINKKSMSKVLYGLYLNSENRWRWFTYENLNTGLFLNSFLFLSDNKLYCLFEPFRLKNITPEEMEKITNPQVLDTLTESDNFVIGVVTF